MPGDIQPQPISGRVDNATVTKTFGWGSITGWVQTKDYKIGICSFSCLTFSIKRDIVKPPPCVVYRWAGAGGRLTRDFRTVSWPKRIGKSSSSYVGSGIVDRVGQVSYGHCLYHASPFCSITCILFHQSIFLHLILYLPFPRLFRFSSTTAHVKFQSLHYRIFILPQNMTVPPHTTTCK